MVLKADVLNCVNDAFPIFCQGELHIDELLEDDSFSAEGVAQKWEQFDELSKNVAAFLSKRFPQLSKRNLAMCCRDQMRPIGEKITRIENRYRLQAALTERSAQC